MNEVTSADRPKLGLATSSFGMAAIVAILFNTGLACAKDAYPRLNNLMAVLTGHHWTTHGLADLVLFAGLGVLFMKTKLPEKIHAGHLSFLLTSSVAVASLGLVLWYSLR